MSDRWMCGHCGTTWPSTDKNLGMNDPLDPIAMLHLVKTAHKEGREEGFAAGVEAAANLMLTAVDIFDCVQASIRIRALAQPREPTPATAAPRCPKCRGLKVIPYIVEEHGRLAGGSKPCPACAPAPAKDGEGET